MGTISVTVSVLAFIFYCKMSVLDSGVEALSAEHAVMIRNNNRNSDISNNNNALLPQPGSLYARYYSSDKLVGHKRMNPVAQRNKVPPSDMDLLMDDDEQLDVPKRYDDYGHMRFGKRGGEDGDDYGHMRFGKRGE